MAVPGRVSERSWVGPYSLGAKATVSDIHVPSMYVVCINLFVFHPATGSRGRGAAEEHSLGLLGETWWVLLS
jgi:hypothetical protein